MVGGPAQEFPPFFSRLKNLALRKQELKSGGDMARPRTQNLTLPIFDFPPPLNADHDHPQLAKPWDDFQIVAQ
jgi:hypothetical protein